MLKTMFPLQCSRKYDDPVYDVLIYDANTFFLQIRVARSKKITKAKFGHKQFQKRPNPQIWKKAKFLMNFW